MILEEIQKLRDASEIVAEYLKGDADLIRVAEWDKEKLEKQKAALLQEIDVIKAGNEQLIKDAQVQANERIEKAQAILDQTIQDCTQTSYELSQIKELISEAEQKAYEQANREVEEKIKKLKLLQAKSTNYIKTESVDSTATDNGTEIEEKARRGRPPKDK